MKNCILIFDDDEDIRNICRIILQSDTRKVVCLPDCKELLNTIGLQKPQVILMDNRIPDIGGVKATQLIKKDERFKHIPVIFFSANPHLHELAAEAGAEFFLAKPFDINDLVSLVEKAITLLPSA